MKNLTGINAETTACEFLTVKGLSLIERNFRCLQGEIDLIMRDQDMIVFVEVRLRNRTDYGNALESIHSHKQMKIIKTATTFLQKKKWLNKVTARFDIVALHPIAGEMQLEWIKNAFCENW